MLLNALTFAAIGLALAYGAVRALPARLPGRPLVLSTGPVAALAGGLIARTILGPGHVMIGLAAAAVMAAALLSLLLRPRGGDRTSSPHPA